MKKPVDAELHTLKLMLAQLGELQKKIGWDEFLKRIKAAPKPPLQAEWFEVGESLNTETSDRALAIVASAFLDDVLGELIKRRLADDDKAGFEKSIPAPGDFARRIHLASSIGLLGVGEAADLRRVKDIRNRFAHRALGLTFDDPDVTEKCDALLLLKNATADGQPLDVSTWPARDKFRMAVFALTSHLQMLIPTVERLPSKQDGEWPFGHPLEHVDSWGKGADSASPSGL